MGRDQRLHVELATHWSPINVQQVLALVDTEAECTLLCGNPDKFSVPEACIDGYGGHSVKENAMQLPLSIGRLLPHHECTVYVSPTPEYILGINVLQGLWLQTTVGEFHLRV